MAVSTSWLQHFQSSGNVYTHSNVIHDAATPQERYDDGTSGKTVASYLPYLLSLGLITSKDTFDNTLVLQEKTGPFKTWYQWTFVDFAFDSLAERQIAIETGEFIQENNLPLGIEVYKERLFVTLPKWKPGVPATLAVLPRTPREVSPLLVPYPNWRWHTTGSCSRLTSVFRIQADICGRLWVLDSGQVDITTVPKQICPPQVLIFDLTTNKLLSRYVLPEDFIKQDGLYTNIAVDIRNGSCGDAHAYLSDVWRYGLVVYSLKSGRSWRITDHLFYPEPLAAAYNVNNLEFEWTDGLFGLALSPYDWQAQDRLLFFHPMSSFRQFYTRTSIICNETGWMDYKDAFSVLGESRGRGGHASASGMDRNGILFFNLVSRNAVGCWDSRKAYKRGNLGLVTRSNVSLVFPNDLKIDNEYRQSVWVISNRLPFYLYRNLSGAEVNFRIMSAYVDDAISGTICDPNARYAESYDHADEDCY